MITNHKSILGGSKYSTTILATEFRKSDSSVNQFFKSIGIDEYSSDVSIEANDLFARIVLFDSEQAIIIESSAIVKMIKEIFEIVWKKIN